MAVERTTAERLTDELRRRILKMQSGDRLPGEQRLAEDCGASRDSIRRALTRLESESLVQTVGRARYVRLFERYEWRPDTFEHRRHRQDEPGTGNDAFTADVAAVGRIANQQVDVTILEAPELVSERLGLAPSTPVVVRRRRRDIDSTPWQLADSYYPMEVAHGTDIMTPGDVVVPGGLMAAAGHEQIRFRDEITVRLPSEEEAHRLQLPASTPVAQHVRTGFDRDEIAVRVIITIAPGDRHVIIYDVTA